MADTMQLLKWVELKLKSGLITINEANIIRQAVSEIDNSGYAICTSNELRYWLTSEEMEERAKCLTKESPTGS